MKKKIMNASPNKTPDVKTTIGSDFIYIALAGIYIISRPLMESPTIIDIAIGVSLILIALKQYIIARRNK